MRLGGLGLLCGLSVPLALSACVISVPMSSATGTASDGSTASGSGEVTGETDATSSGETDATSSGETGSTTDAPFTCSCPTPTVLDGDLTLTDDTADLDPCIVEITGVLRIEGVTDPAALQPLAHLQRARAVLIDDNPGLVDLEVMACLEEVFTLRVAHNPALTDLGGLGRVRVAPTIILDSLPILELPALAPDYAGIGSLSLHDLPEIVDLDLLASWPSVPNAGDNLAVSVSELPKLTSVTGLVGPLGPPSPETTVHLRLTALPSLTSLEGVEAVRTGYVWLVDLPKIPSLAPLAGLQVAHTLEVNRAPLLGSLDGLQALTKTGDLRLLGLPGLASLAGLEGLETASRLQLGGCVEGDGLAGIVDLSGLDTLTTVGDLLLVNNPALAALTGAPALSQVWRADLVDNPMLGADAIAAFESQTAPMSLCVGDPARCGCLKQVPGGLQAGCAAGWSGGSSVTVTGVGGPMTGVTAFFGWQTDSSEGYDPELEVVVLDGDADVDAALATPSWELPPDAARPQLRFTGTAPYQAWIGVDSGYTRLLQPGAAPASAEVQITVTDRLGDWLTFDPDDPPRLVGYFETLDPEAASIVEGPFEAAYCDALTHIIPI
ncbi:MAG: hypothetical protein R3B09_10810 [Nannocystaceae bacterium]